MIRGERFRRPLLLVGGRGAQGPAPVSASLYRLRRQTALRGTLSPSSRRHVGGAEWTTALRGTLGGRSISRPPAPAPSQQGLGRKGHSRHPPISRSAWAWACRSFPPSHQSPSAGAGRALIPTYPQKPPKAARGGSCPALSSRYGVPLHRAVVEGETMVLRTVSLRESHSRKPYSKAPSRQPSAESTPTSLRASKERDRWSSGRQSAAKP